MLKRFATYVPEGGEVLDLGCGAGRPIGAHLLRQGFQVTGVDQSSALLTIAQQRLPTGKWHRQNIEKFAPKRMFHGIVAWDSLFHIPRTRHARISERLRRALTPGAPFLLTLGGSAHPAFTDVMFNQSFFYDSFPPEAAAQLLRDTGFAIETSEYLDRPETDADGQPVGRNKGRIVLLARVL
jgi:trans-aconitate methyltransferase